MEELTNDNIDDELNEPDLNTNLQVFDWLFPIKGYDCNDNFKDGGTGFLINNDGVFVTAAHNLLNRNLKYVAIKNDEDLEFSICFIEYVDRKYRDNICCKDLAICKIKKSIDLIPMLKFKEFQHIKVKIRGFKRDPQQFGLTYITFGKLYLHEYCFDSFKETSNTSSNYDKSKNVASLELNPGKEYHGLSGGPVFDENNIYGMLIGKDYILSNYIISKLNELGISYDK